MLHKGGSRICRWLLTIFVYIHVDIVTGIARTGRTGGKDGVPGGWWPRGVRLGPATHALRGCGCSAIQTAHGARMAHWPSQARKKTRATPIATVTVHLSYTVDTSRRHPPQGRHHHHHHHHGFYSRIKLTCGHLTQSRLANRSLHALPLSLLSTVNDCYSNPFSYCR